MATFTQNPVALSSGTVSVPPGGVVIPANAHTATVTFAMPIDAERQNPANRMDFSIDLSTNAGGTWKPYLNAGWNGNTGTGKNSTVIGAVPNAGLGGDFFGAYAGSLVRLTVHLDLPMTLGATVTVL